MVLAVLATVVLHGCAAGAARPGVYLVAGGGNPHWIGDPLGVPVWSPDGQDLIWGSEDGLFKRSADGGEAVVLGSAAVAGRPAWSPDGDEIAFVDRASGSLVVIGETGAPRYSIPLSTQRSDRPPAAIPELGGPAWSPDGEKVAYNCWDGAGDELCLIDADGTHRRQLTRLEPAGEAVRSPAVGFEPARANTGPPAWSPDGAMLAVAAYPERRGAASGVFVVDLADGVLSRVSEMQPNSAIAWYPDGRASVFSATRDGRSDVYRLELESRQIDNLSEGLPNGARQPALSANGQQALVVSGRTLVVLGRGDGQIFSLPNDLRPEYPAWSPRSDAIAFGASPDPLTVYN
jgi:Tol biopolymer transport system component